MQINVHLHVLDYVELRGRFTQIFVMAATHLHHPLITK